MELRYLSSVIQQLSFRHSDLTRRRQWLLSQPVAIESPKRFEQALQYESLIAKLSELEGVIEMLADALTLEHNQLLKRNRHIDAYLKKAK